MSELTLFRSIKLQFHGSSVYAKLGNDAELTMNLKDLSAALSMTSAYVGLKTCLGIGGAAVATFLALKLIKKNWDWMDIKNVNAEHEMTVSFSKDHRNKFDEIIQNKEMEVYLKEEFANPSEIVRKIVDDESYSQELVDEVTEKVKGYQLKSVTSELLPSLPQGTVGRYIHPSAKVNEKLYNKKSTVAGADGNVYGEVITGTVTREEHGGTSIVVGGISGDQATKIAMSSGSGDILKVTVRFSDLKVQSLVLDFAKGQILRDLRTAIVTQNGMDCIIKHARTGKILDEFATFDELQKEYPDILDRYLEAEKRP